MILWDGGNNDLPFFRPDLLIVVVDPLRAGHELHYHPGETNLRMADVVVDQQGRQRRRRRASSVSNATSRSSTRARRSSVRRRRSRSSDGPPLAGRCVLVVEDGPTLTHGGMPFGAATVAAEHEGAALRVDPRATAVGSIAQVFERLPAHRRRAAGDGLRRRAARRARGDDQRAPTATSSSPGRRSTSAG